MLFNFAELLSIVADFAVAAALIVTIWTFMMTYNRGRNSEQMKIAHDISRDFAEAENNILRTPNDEQHKREWISRNQQYLNVWEWFSFLINHEEIKNKNIEEYFRPKLIRDFESTLSHPDLKSLRDEYDELKELKELYAKWKHQK